MSTRVNHAVAVLATFIIACGGDDSDKKRSSAQMGWGDGGSSQLDLSGLWVSNDFACGAARLREFVDIEQVERNVTGVKVTGDECVPAGYVSFEGKLPRADLSYLDLPIRFPVRGYSGEQGRPGTIAVTATGEALVTAPDVVQLVFSNVSVRLTRSDEDPSAPTSAEPTAGTGSTRSRTPAVERDDAGLPDEDEPANSDAGSRSGRSTTRRAARPDAAVSDLDAAAETTDAAAEPTDTDVGTGASDAAVGDAGPVAEGDCPNPFLPGASCDHVAQCGCAQGENCRFDDRVPPSCFPEGPSAEREPCATASDCAAGLTCAYDVCVRMCEIAGDCDRGECVDASLDGVDVEGLRFCVEECDPVLSASCYDTPSQTMCQPCGIGRMCMPGSEVALCVATSNSRPRELGSACTDRSECYAADCYAGTCQRWCHADIDCSGIGETCLVSSDLSSASGELTGRCIALMSVR